jgi:hypothetical protein
MVKSHRRLTGKTLCGRFVGSVGSITPVFNQGGKYGRGTLQFIPLKELLTKAAKMSLK